MQTVGRNDPCPCGSGQKYKRCCLMRAQQRDDTWARVRQAEGTIIDGVMAELKSRGELDLVRHAWDDFRLADDGGREEPLPLDDPLFQNTFIPWLAFNWIPLDDSGRPARRPLALDLVTRHMRRFDAIDCRFAAEACRRAYSFYTVVDVAPGHSLTLQDVLTHAEYVVLERTASIMAAKGAIVYTRIVPLDSVCIMSGCAPSLIPAGERLGLLDLRYALTRKRKPMSEEALHTYADEIRYAYFEIDDRLRNPRAPQLCNTDGDPLSMQTLHFELRCPPRSAFERLRSLALGCATDECLEESAVDSAGALRMAKFNWLRAGNAKHASWDNTILGSIRIDGTALTAHVNSQRRAEGIRAEIEQRLGADVTYKNTLIENVEKMLAERRGRPETKKERRAREETERLSALPEVQAHLTRMAEEHWRSWLDEKIPALRNRTPRQASKTAEGRERLEALLASFAADAAQQAGSPFAPDVTALRQALGLDGG